MIRSIALLQMRTFARQRILHTTIGVTAGFAALAGVLGWASHQTIIGVYDESSKLLAQRGQAAPPNPFLLKPSLSMLANEIIYVTMIGALVAIVVGHIAIAEDESNGIGRLVFIRAIQRTRYAVGKLSACALLLGIASTSCFVVSVGALTIVDRFPSGTDLTRLAAFYLLAWLYSMVWTLVGAIGVLLTSKRPLALLGSISAWLTVTFAFPQFTSGLRPTQSLNPIVDPVSTSQTLFRIAAKARPYSLAEQFKEAAGRVLSTAASEPISQTRLRIAPIVAAVVILCAVAWQLIERHDYSRSNPE